MNVSGEVMCGTTMTVSGEVMYGAAMTVTGEVMCRECSHGSESDGGNPCQTHLFMRLALFLAGAVRMRGV